MDHISFGSLKVFCSTFEKLKLYKNNLDEHWGLKGQLKKGQQTRVTNFTINIMQFAFINNVRTKPFPNGRSTCPICGGDMIAKCGNRIIHHWAHIRETNCDPWWETETQWHRDWKNLFPEDCREVSHMSIDGEIHRADIKTPTGIIIEFQHSPISDRERISREQFYGNLIWVVDGLRFKKNFDILHRLPAPNSEVAKDIVWFKAKRSLHGASKGLFWCPSENPDVDKSELPLVLIHSADTIQNLVDETYCGHHQYDWIRPHKTWQETTYPLYLDFGEDTLARLETYGSNKLPCIRLITKRKFMHDVCTESIGKNIATRFYRF